MSGYYKKSQTQNLTEPLLDDFQDGQNQQTAKLNLETQDAASKAPKDGETLFIEEYAPFGVGEICGDFQDSETITGMQGSNHHKNQMEMLFTQMGLEI